MRRPARSRIAAALLLPAAAWAGATSGEEPPGGANGGTAAAALAQSAAEGQAADSSFQARFQTTYNFQKKPSFHAAYTGPNSLSPDTERSYTWTATAYLGWRPWTGTELFAVPEVTQGLPFSNLTGLAGFTNGELTRASGTNPRLYRQKLYVRQTWNRGGAAEPVESDLEEFAKKVDRNRFVVTLGNFSALDVFDDNAYAKDPRTQFLNWSNMAYAAYDYPADARGFSWGLTAEWYQGDWVVRAGRMAVPHDPNQLPLDTNLGRHYGDQIELEHGHTIAGQPGRVRLLAYRDRARMASFQDALAYLQEHPGGDPAAIFFTRTADKVKYGFGINIEQALTGDAGIFLRAMMSDGKTETLAFTESDKSVAAGVSVKGSKWGRPQDTLGVAHMQSMLSRDRRNYLEAGGISFFIGDGALNYAAERIVEGYYSLGLARGLTATLDYQHIWNPAYNADRGPVDVFGLRLHFQY